MIADKKHYPPIVISEEEKRREIACDARLTISDVSDENGIFKASVWFRFDGRAIRGEGHSLSRNMAVKFALASVSEQIK